MIVLQPVVQVGAGALVKRLARHDAGRPGREDVDAGGHPVEPEAWDGLGWPDRALTQEVYAWMFAAADVVLASAQDLRLLHGEEGASLEAAARSGRDFPGLVAGYPGTIVPSGAVSRTASARDVA